MLNRLNSIFWVLPILFFLGACDAIPFPGEEDDDSDLTNLLVLIAAANQANSNSASSANCGGSNGGPTDRRGQTEVEQGGSHYGAGYSQVSSNRQNAYAYKRTGDNFNWCRYYDSSAADTRGVVPAINNDGSELFVAFTTDGGNADFRATSNAVQRSYGRGGGAKVTFLARINPADGSIRHATYLGARLTNGDTNTLTPDSITIGSDRVTFVGSTRADRPSTNDALDTANCAPGATRTVVMPFELTRDSPFSVACSQRD